MALDLYEDDWIQDLKSIIRFFNVQYPLSVTVKARSDSQLFRKKENYLICNNGKLITDFKVKIGTSYTVTLQLRTHECEANRDLLNDHHARVITQMDEKIVIEIQNSESEHSEQQEPVPALQTKAQ